MFLNDGPSAIVVYRATPLNSIVERSERRVCCMNSAACLVVSIYEHLPQWCFDVALVRLRLWWWEPNENPLLALLSFVWPGAGFFCSYWTLKMTWSRLLQALLKRTALVRGVLIWTYHIRRKHYRKSNDHITPYIISWINIIETGESRFRYRSWRTQYRARIRSPSMVHCFTSTVCTRLNDTRVLTWCSEKRLI